MLLKAIVIGLLLALGEVVNGNIRVRILHRLYGKKRAKTISLFSGSAIILAISWFALPFISPKTYLDCIAIGFVWLVMLLCLDIYFGKHVFKFGWKKIRDDFNPLMGNLLSIGMMFLFLSPSIVFWLQQ